MWPLSSALFFTESHRRIELYCTRWRHRTCTSYRPLHMRKPRSKRCICASVSVTRERTNTLNSVPATWPCHVASTAADAVAIHADIRHGLNERIAGHPAQETLQSIRASCPARPDSRVRACERWTHSVCMRSSVCSRHCLSGACWCSATASGQPLWRLWHAAAGPYYCL